MLLRIRSPVIYTPPKYGKLVRKRRARVLKEVSILWNKKIGARRLENLLERRKLDCLWLDVDVSGKRDYKYRRSTPVDQAPTVGKLYLYRSSWVDFENFFTSFNSRRIACPVPSSRTANHILKQWIDGDFNNVEELSLKLRAPTTTRRVPYVLDVVLAGIETDRLPGVSDERRLRSWAVLEFRRASDGKRARIYIHLECNINITIQFDDGIRTLPPFF